MHAPPARARPMRRGWRRCCRGATAPTGGAAAAVGAVDHADARARRRHRSRARARRGGAAAALDGRRAHRRHAAAERARQDAALPTALVTTPESLSLLLSRADWRERFAHLRARRRRRMARAPRRASAACRSSSRSRGCARCNPRCGLGPVGDARATSTRRWRCCSGPSRERDGRIVRGHRAKTHRRSTRCSPPTSSASRGRGHIGMQLLPEVVAAIERARTTLVFTNMRSPAEIWYQALLEARPRLGRHDRAAPRLARPRRARLGRGRAREGRCARSCARRASTSASTSRRSSGCCRSAAPRASRGCCSAPAAAATGPARVARHRGADARARAGRGGGGARRRAGRDDRAARRRSTAARRAGAAPRHVRAGRRLRPGGAARRGAHDARLPRTSTDARVAMGARLRRARRREPQRLSRVPARRRSATTASPACPIAQIARRHRMQIGTIVSDAAITVQFSQRHEARPRRGVVHRAPAPGRLLRVRRARARIHARPRDDGLRAARAARAASSALDGREDAAVDAARRAHARADRRRAARALRMPELAAVRPLLELQRRWSALPDERDGWSSASRRREGHHLFFYPFDGRHAHSGSPRCSPIGCRARRRARSASRSTTTASSCCRREPVELDARRRSGTLLARRPVEPTSARRLERGRARRRRSARSRASPAWCSRAIRASRSEPPAAGVERADLRRVRRVRSGQLLLAQAEREVLERQLEARASPPRSRACARSARSSRRRRARRRSRFR